LTLRLIGLQFVEDTMHSAFHVGQLVRTASVSPTEVGGRVYCIVNVLPSDGADARVYRIKSMAGDERVVRPDEIRIAPTTAVP
jgi:hypothetical protein